MQISIRDVCGGWQRLFQLDVNLIAQPIDVRLNHLISQAERESEARRDLVRVVEVKGETVRPEVCCSERYCHVRSANCAEKEICNSVADVASSEFRGGIRRICDVVIAWTAEKELSTGELVSILVVDVVAILAAESHRMLALHQREVVDDLKDLVIDRERTVRLVAERAQAGAKTGASHREPAN